MTSIDRRLTFARGRIVAVGVVLTVILVQGFTGWYLGTAVVAAVAVASPTAWFVIQRYWKRDRGLRFGPVGMVIALVLVWLVLLGVCFFFFYYPGSIWPGRL